MCKKKRIEEDDGRVSVNQLLPDLEVLVSVLLQVEQGSSRSSLRPVPA